MADKLHVDLAALQLGSDHIGSAAGDAAMLLNDLSRDIYVAESDLILNGTVSGNGFDGYNNLSGTLTYGAGADEPLPRCHPVRNGRDAE